MDATTLLVVCDGEAREGIERTYEPVIGGRVRVLADIDRLLHELCFETVDCVLVAPTVGGTTGANVASALRTLFPALPVVVAGLDPTEADELDVISPGSTDLTDDRVVDAVESALVAETDSAASRPPSRLETLLAAMFDGFTDHMYAKDDRARHVLTNGASIPLAEAVGLTDRGVEEGPEGHHAEKTVSDDERVIDGEPIVDVEEYTDGTDEYSLTTKVPWYDGAGDVVGLVGITRDISDRKAREQELRQQNERLGKVALVAAHELRNELQVATGRVALLEDDPDQVDVVGESLDRLSAIVDDVVALAGQERRVLDEQEIWISTPVHEVWESLDTSSATVELTGDRRILADLEALRLLFDVLLSNAVDHGGPDVTVTVGGTENGFYVADDGPGIDADPPERVFDAGFAGADEHPGFGLYVAQRITNDHGWQLDVRNRPEGGARFDVTGVTEV